MPQNRANAPNSGKYIRFLAPAATLVGRRTLIVVSRPFKGHRTWPARLACHAAQRRQARRFMALARRNPVDSVGVNIVRWSTYGGPLIDFITKKCRHGAPPLSKGRGVWLTPVRFKG